MTGAIVKGRHRFGVWEVARLFCRYQAYAVLVLGLAALPLVATALWLPTRWWAWLIAVPITLRVGSFGVYVSSRWRRKLRITAVAQRRIDAGRFRPEMVHELCGDPCHRSVSDEILRRYGMDRPTRRSIIGSQKERLAQEASQTLIIDHRRGTVLTVEGDRVVQLEPSPPTATPGRESLVRGEPMPRPGVS